MANRILLITSNNHDAATLESALKKAQDGPFTIEWVTRLALAQERLQAPQHVAIDAILVDLELPDSTGLATFTTLFAWLRVYRS